MNTTKNSVLVETWHYTDKTYGNSYWAGEVRLNGGVIISAPMSYGYERQNEYDLKRLLVVLGVIAKKHETENLEFALIKSGFVAYIVRHENALRRELRRFGENGKTITYPSWIEHELHGTEN